MNYYPNTSEHLYYSPPWSSINSSNIIIDSSNKIYYQLNIYFPLGNTSDLYTKYYDAIQKQNKMATQFTWVINQLNCLKENSEGLQDVINVIHWTYNANDIEFQDQILFSNNEVVLCDYKFQLYPKPIYEVAFTSFVDFYIRNNPYVVVTFHDRKVITRVLGTPFDTIYVPYNDYYDKLDSIIETLATYTGKVDTVILDCPLLSAALANKIWDNLDFSIIDFGKVISFARARFSNRIAQNEKTD